MARDFLDGTVASPSKSYLNYSPVLTNWTSTWLIWIRLETNVSSVPMHHGDLTNNRMGFILTANDARFQTFASGANSTGNLTEVVNDTLNTWTAWIGRADSTGRARMTLNGSTSLGGGVSLTFGTHTNLVINAQTFGGDLAYGLDAKMAHAAIWDVELDDAEIAMIEAGVPPMLVRPQSLVFYDPLEATGTGNSRDIIAGRIGTVGGINGVGDTDLMPRVTNPYHQLLVGVPGSGGGGVGPPVVELPPGTIDFPRIVRDITIRIVTGLDRDKQ